MEKVHAGISHGGASGSDESWGEGHASAAERSDQLRGSEVTRGVTRDHHERPLGTAGDAVLLQVVLTRCVDFLQRLIDARLDVCHLMGLVR